MMEGNKMARIAAVVTAVAIVLAGTIELARADARRIATLAPEGSLWMKQLEEGAAKIEKATEGRVKTKYYGGGSQGDERDVIRKMRLGQLDGSALTAVGLAIIYPGIRVLQLPHFFDSVEELDYVRTKTWKYFQKRFRKQGFELLVPGDIGWIHLFSTKPIRSRPDLEKAKLWIWQGDPLASKLAKELKFNGVPLSVPEVLPALSSGRIDACFGSPLAAVALQWHTVVKYMTSLRVVYGIGGMVIRTEVWKDASKEDLEIQMKIGKKMMKKGLKRIRRDNKRALKALKREGMKIIESPKEMIAEFEETAQTMWQAGVGSAYTQQELDMVLEYRKKYRDKQAKKVDKADRRAQQ